MDAFMRFQFLVWHGTNASRGSLLSGGSGEKTKFIRRGYNIYVEIWNIKRLPTNDLRYNADISWLAREDSPTNVLLRENSAWAQPLGRFTFEKIGGQGKGNPIVLCLNKLVNIPGQTHLNFLWLETQQSQEVGMIPTGIAHFSSDSPFFGLLAF
jgi:hypothetical protein